jgi:hypothetical protein
MFTCIIYAPLLLDKEQGNKLNDVFLPLLEFQPAYNFYKKWDWSQMDCAAQYKELAHFQQKYEMLSRGILS